MGVWKALGVVASNELLHGHVHCRGDLRKGTAAWPRNTTALVDHRRVVRLAHRCASRLADGPLEVGEERCKVRRNL